MRYQSFVLVEYYLSSGHVSAAGDIKTVIPAYLYKQSSSPRVVDLLSRARPEELAGKVRLVTACPSDGISSWLLPFGQRLRLDISIDAQSSYSPKLISSLACGPVEVSNSHLGPTSATTCNLRYVLERIPTGLNSKKCICCRVLIFSVLHFCPMDGSRTILPKQYGLKSPLARSSKD